MKESIRKFFIDVEVSNIEDKYDIHSGGCGCFAMLVLKFFPHLDVVFCSPILKYMEDKIPHAPRHIVLTDGKFYYDAEGIHTKNKLLSRYDKIEKVSKKYLKESVLTASNWNNGFKRNDLPKIEKFLEKCIK